MDEILVRIRPNGRIVALYDERLDLNGLGHTYISRASHVEPTLDCRWTVSLFPLVVGGLTLGPFASRSEALAAEVEYIKTHYL